MTFLTEEQIQNLEQLTNNHALAQRWRGMGERMRAGNTITIANTGLVNSGKSSLFNVLLSPNGERFPVGAVRTTSRGDREAIEEGIDLLDTPGIDVDAMDNEQAYSAVVSADLIVVVHNIKLGPLTRSEFEWLQRLAGDIPAEERAWRVLFVCSWKDERDREPDYSKLVQKVRDMVTDALGAEVPFWELSSKRYRTGFEKQKESLIRSSGIPAFRDALLASTRKAQGQIAAKRQTELNKLCRETSEELQYIASSSAAFVERKEQEIRRRYAIMFETWNSVYENFRDRQREVYRKLEKLKDTYQGSVNLREYFADPSHTPVTPNTFESFLREITEL